MATIDEIKKKYLGDDAFTKAANAIHHESAKYKGKIPANVLKRMDGTDIAKAYADSNKFKLASIGYDRNGGWVVYARRMGSMNPTEAQAYAQDLLKAVAAIKKAPAIKK